MVKFSTSVFVPDYLYFVNHYSSHWALEVLDVTEGRRLELTSADHDDPEVVAAFTQKQ